MDVAADLAILIRNIASEIHGGQGPSGSAVVDGRVIDYNQKDNLLSVALLHYTRSNGEPFILPVPYAMFMAGDTYGDYFYPENGLICTIAVVESATGESIQVNFSHDALNPPATLHGNADQVPYPSIIAPLQPGERLILHKAGFALRFMAGGGIQAGSITNGGQIPAAVEGSTVTHNHTLGAFLGGPLIPASFMGALAAAIAASAGNPPGLAALVALQTALLAAIIPPISGGTAVISTTDNAGAVPSVPPSPPWLAPTTHAAVDGGQGAQSFLLPGPGQD